MADLEPQLVERFQRAYNRAWHELGSKKSFSAADVYDKLQKLLNEDERTKLTKQRVVAMLGNDSRLRKEEVGGKNLYQYLPQPPPAPPNGSAKKGKDRLKPFEPGRLPAELGARGDRRYPMLTRCMALYKRLHTQAPNVLSAHLQEVNGGSPENYFRKLDDNMLWDAQCKLEDLCRKHAPEVSEGLRMECCSALAEMMKPANEAKLNSLTADQQEFVRAFQTESKPEKRKLLVDDKTVAYIRDFIGAANKPLGAVDPVQDDVIDLDATKINPDVFRQHFPKRADETKTPEGEDVIVDNATQEELTKLNRQLGELQGEKKNLEDQVSALSPKAKSWEELQAFWKITHGKELTPATVKEYMDTHVPRTELDGRLTPQQAQGLQDELRQARQDRDGRLSVDEGNAWKRSIKRLRVTVWVLAVTLGIMGVAFGFTLHSRALWVQVAQQLQQQ